MPFKPGQSGCPGGGVREKKFVAALDRAILADDGKRLRAAAERLLDDAASGLPWAITMLADRLDGKPHQSVEAAISGGINVTLDQSDADA